MWVQTTHYEKARALVRALFAVDPVLPRITVQPSTLRRCKQMAQ